MLHMFPMYFEHVVSFRFGIQATFGPYVSLSSALQAALGHETTVCVTFGARRRNTYVCRCHGYATITCFPTFWARRPWRDGFQCGLVHTQQRRCRDFAMWTLNGGPFGCQLCPLLLIHDAPFATLLSPVCCRFHCLAISSSIFFVRV